MLIVGYLGIMMLRKRFRVDNFLEKGVLTIKYRPN